MLVDWRVHGPFESSLYLAPVNSSHIIFATQRLEQCLAHKYSINVWATGECRSVHADIYIFQEQLKILCQSEVLT